MTPLDKSKARLFVAEDHAATAYPQGRAGPIASLVSLSN